MPRCRDWTPEEDAVLLEFAESGASLHVAAATIGRSHHGAVNRLFRLRHIHNHTNRRHAPWTPELDETLLAMRAGGASFAEISRRIGRTKGSVSSRAEVLARRADQRGEAAATPDAGRSYAGFLADVKLATLATLTDDRRPPVFDTADDSCRGYLTPAYERITRYMRPRESESDPEVIRANVARYVAEWKRREREGLRMMPPGELARRERERVMSRAASARRREKRSVA